MKTNTETIQRRSRDQDSPQHFDVEGAARSVAIAAHLAAREMLFHMATDTVPRLRVSSNSDHHGDPAAVVDGLANDAATAEIHQHFPGNTLTTGEEAGTATTIHRPGRYEVAIDPVDGTTLLRCFGFGWASVVLVFKQTRIGKTFETAVIVYPDGFLHRVSADGQVRLGQTHRRTEDDLPVRRISTHGIVDAVASVASKQVKLLRLQRIASDADFAKIYNVGGTPTTWGFLHGSLAALVETEPTMPCDAAGLLFVSALGGCVLRIDTMEPMTFDDVVGIFESGAASDSRVPPYVLWKVSHLDGNDGADTLRRIIAPFVVEGSPDPALDEERLNEIMAGVQSMGWVNQPGNHL